MHQWTTGDAPISIHALREEGDHGRRRQHRDRPISIHALREEGDVRNCSAAARSAGYFYPRPPRGGRRFVLSSRSISVIFLSTPSARRATTDAGGSTETGLFLSTPSARRATSGTAVLLHEAPDISIHALREEGDALSCRHVPFP